LHVKTASTNPTNLMPLWLRAILVTLLFPGMVAGVFPVWIARGAYQLPLELGAARWLGLIPLAAGVVILLLTIWDFFAIGRGTLAPWDAPEALVHDRLYRWVRNPMYLGVLATILGQALLRSAGGVLIYLALIAVAFHIRVIAFEEPALGRQLGVQYTRYLQQVPRWLPRPPRQIRPGSAPLTGA
jgi:protein-S-isoprenylcysteine O-methyltransferase Ste14